ncbi:MAG TPA: hypothetical protein VEG25_04955 [Burkholderiales bacterium]|nr:hypothetical protein [Burkholderiales bacterium]
MHVAALSIDLLLKLESASQALAGGLGLGYTRVRKAANAISTKGEIMLGRSRIGKAMLAALAGMVTAACTTLGPQAIDQTRLEYNEVVKRTTEEQLLLNIVRLRYNDTPSSLAVSSIAAQFERSQSVQLVPFFTSAGSVTNSSYAAVLPQAGVAGADRPTITLTPLDDQEFTRKLFTPLPLDGVLYLAKTTWPISTVFRLYLENLNWVSNAQTASGPTPREAPVVSEFLHGMAVLQILQDRSEIVFGVDERVEQLGGSLPFPAVGAGDMVEAAKNGYEYRPDSKGSAWTLIRKTTQPVVRIDPEALNSPEVQDFVRVFHLKPGLTQYNITEEKLNPFPSTYPPEGVTSLDLETRSLLQALYYVCQGVEIPPEHARRGFVTTTFDPRGHPFDWEIVMRNFFRVRSLRATTNERPPSAHVAVKYKDYWFYIDETDQDTKSTFSLLMELARLELAGKPGPAPQLTLPIGR